MSRILHWRFCGTLSMMLAVCMVLPVMALAGSVVTSAKPVVIANSPGDCKISLGKGEDARVGAKGVISRHDKDIAKFEITSVEWGYSCIKLTDVSANETVLVGDGIQLTTVPPATKIKKASSAGKTIAFLLFVGALVALGSGKGGGHSSSSAQTVTLQATQTSLPADGASTTPVTATVVDSKNAAVPDGTPVTFSASAGAISPASTTTTGGTATATLTSAATAGQCTVTARAGSVENTVTVAFLNTTAGAPHGIIAEVAPAAIECDGNSFATVTVTVTDIAGNPVTDGTIVDFSVERDANLGGNGTVTPEARTTNGQATALLWSRDSSGNISNAGTATVFVTVSRAKQLAAGIPAPAADISNHETQVQFISLDVDAIEMYVTGQVPRGDAVATTLEAMVYDSNHNPVPDGTAVYFTATAGMIYGNSGTAGRVTTSITATGIAQATLINLPVDFPVEVTATSGAKTAQFTVNP